MRKYLFKEKGNNL
jgi:DNA repair exonuclease SbcCD ATPase subunit